MSRVEPARTYVLGLDLGTSSLKGLLVCSDGTTSAPARHDYPIARLHGWEEQDPEHWWQAVGAVVRDLLTRVDAEPRDIRALAVGGQMHGTVLLGDDEAVLRPAIIWTDGRAAAQAVEAERVLDAHGLLPRLGGGVSPGFMLASLLWLRTHEPEVWGRAAHTLLPKDYLRYRLTGVLATDPSDACGIPALDLYDDTWSRPALEALDLPPRLLPPLLPSRAIAGVVTPEAAAETGLHAGTPVVCGGSDQAMGALGAGLLAPGTLLLSVSSGGQLVTPLQTPLAAPVHGLRTLRHALPTTYLALSATLGASLTLQWVAETMLGLSGEDAVPGLLAMAARVPPGANGLLMLPYLRGERAPLLDPRASGVLMGLRHFHGRTHLARAALDGVALSLRHALEPLEDAGVQVHEIVLAGGAARDVTVQAVLAAVLGRAVQTLHMPEQSALGAALLAAVSAEFYPDLPAACAALVHRTTQPAPAEADVALYAALYARYRGLYPLLREEMHGLHE